MAAIKSSEGHPPLLFLEHQSVSKYEDPERPGGSQWRQRPASPSSRVYRVISLLAGPASKFLPPPPPWLPLSPGRPAAPRYPQLTFPCQQEGSAVGGVWVWETVEPTFESPECLGQVTSPPRASVSPSVTWACHTFLSGPW